MRYASILCITAMLNIYNALKLNYFISAYLKAIERYNITFFSNFIHQGLLCGYKRDSGQWVSRRFLDNDTINNQRLQQRLDRLWWHSIQSRYPFIEQHGVTSKF